MIKRRYSLYKNTLYLLLMDCGIYFHYHSAIDIYRGLLNIYFSELTLLGLVLSKCYC